MTWNTGRKSDSYEQAALIRTNDPTAPEITLTVRGEIASDLIVPEKFSFPNTDAGERAACTVGILSQVCDSFSILDVRCELPGFLWDVEPLELNEVEMEEQGATSGLQLNLSCLGTGRGKKDSTVYVDVLLPGSTETVTKEMQAMVKTRGPVTFISKDIHSTRGLEFDTLVNDQEHEIRLIARPRGIDADKRTLTVLDFEPSQLEVECERITDRNDYRVTIRIPKDCPPVMFNRDQEHGYVQIGDADDPAYSNWFPVIGAVIAPPQ